MFQIQLLFIYLMFIFYFASSIILMTPQQI